MVEQEAQTRSREALDPADRLCQGVQETPATAAAAELELAPALGQPDRVAPGHELKRHKDRDDLEHVCGATGRQRQRRNAQQEDEDERKALFWKMSIRPPSVFSPFVASQRSISSLTLRGAARSLRT
jgi:hypothetical protein